MTDHPWFPQPGPLQPRGHYRAMSATDLYYAALADYGNTSPEAVSCRDDHIRAKELAKYGRRAVTIQTPKIEVPKSEHTGTYQFKLPF